MKTLEEIESEIAAPENTHENLPAPVTLGATEIARLKESDAQYAEVILDKLTTGKLDRFDGEAVELLSKVLHDENRVGMLETLKEGSTDLALWAGAVLGPKIAGVGGGGVAAEFGSGAISEKITAWASAQLVEKLGSIWAQADSLQDFLAAVSAVSETLSKIPLGIAGYLGASMATGAGLEMMREYRRSGDFATLQEYMDKSRGLIRDEEGQSADRDPRLDLIALQRMIAEDPNQLGYDAVDNAEWMNFVGAVREAKISLVRDKLQLPEVVRDPAILKSLELDVARIEKFLIGQERLTEVDMDAVTQILERFECVIEPQVAESQQRLEKYSGIIAKIRRYGGAALNGALNGTGLPTLWKMAKFTTRAATKTAATVSSGGLNLLT